MSIDLLHGLVTESPLMNLGYISRNGIGREGYIDVGYMGERLIYISPPSRHGVGVKYDSDTQ